MDVARLNFSHGTHEQHAETAQLVRDAAGRAGRPVALLQDLPGPKLRIGPLVEGTVELKVGDKVVFECGRDDGRRRRAAHDDQLGGPGPRHRPGRSAVSRRRLGAAAGDRGPRRRAGGRGRGRGRRHGRRRQGLNIPGPADELPSVPEEDFAHLEAGRQIGVDMVALSFVRRPEDVLTVREHTRVPLIAKIEKPQAVEQRRGDHPRRRLHHGRARRPRHRAADRGGPDRPEDASSPWPARTRGPSSPRRRCSTRWSRSSRPTRAEVADVANAILDGTDAIMLCQESAVGAYPVGAIEMMSAIAMHTERHAPYQRWLETRVQRDHRDPSYTVAHAACQAARRAGARRARRPDALGPLGARLISAHRPDTPIYALSPGRETVRRCGLMWGVRAASMRRHEVTEELITDACARVVELGWCRPGMRVGITAGLPSGRPGTTSPVPGPGALKVAAGREPAADRHHDEHDDRRDRLGRAEVVERAAQRGVGERARRAAERGRGGEGAQRHRRQARGVVDQRVRDARHDPRVEDRQEPAAPDPRAQRRAGAGPGAARPRRAPASARC